MTNADATARVLAGVTVIGSIVALALITRAMSKPGHKPVGLLLAWFFFSLGLLVYSAGRVLAGPDGRAMSVEIVAGAMITCSVVGILISWNATRSRRSGSASLN